MAQGYQKRTETDQVQAETTISGAVAQSGRPPRGASRGTSSDGPGRATPSLSGSPGHMKRTPAGTSAGVGAQALTKATQRNHARLLRGSAEIDRNGPPGLRNFSPRYSNGSAKIHQKSCVFLGFLPKKVKLCVFCARCTDFYAETMPLAMQGLKPKRGPAGANLPF